MLATSQMCGNNPLRVICVRTVQRTTARQRVKEDGSMTDTRGEIWMPGSLMGRLERSVYMNECRQTTNEHRGRETSS